mgnify:FL=1
MKILELFCGSKSFTNYMKTHYICDTITLDIDENCNPDILIDILEWDYTQQEPPDILWCSPDCRSFSNQAYGGYIPQRRHSDMKPLTASAELGDKLLHTTIDIINYFMDKNPNMVWLMENPRGTMYRSPILARTEYYQNKTRYCDYGDNRTKRTDIFSNKKLRLKNTKNAKGTQYTCNGLTREGVYKKGCGGWNGKGIDKGKVPPELLKEILQQILK